MNTSSPSTSRREVVKYAAGLGLLAPFAMGTQRGAGAQDEMVDYSGHPAVGVWMTSNSVYPYALHKFEYQVVSSDGTVILVSPWLTHYMDSLGIDVGDPLLPATLFGVWRPTSDTTTEGTARVFWGDTSVTMQMTFWTQGEVRSEGAQFQAATRFRAVDPRSGDVLLDEAMTIYAERMEVEPFEVLEATPEG